MPLSFSIGRSHRIPPWGRVHCLLGSTPLARDAAVHKHKDRLWAQMTCDGPVLSRRTNLSVTKETVRVASNANGPN